MDYVSFSGGKDSTALALLFPDAIPIFSDTGWEHKEVLDHIAKFEFVTGRTVVRVKNQKYPGGIPEYARHAKFFPNHGARYCTRMFKIEPINDYLEKHLPVNLMIGLRADEPMDTRVGNLSDIEGLSISYPLRDNDLNLYDVLRICTERDLLPRYPVHMARGGCEGCFYKRKSQVIALAHLDKPVINGLKQLENDVQDYRGKFFYMFSNLGMSIDELLKQPLLFEANEVFPDQNEGNLSCGLFCRR